MIAFEGEAEGLKRYMCLADLHKKSSSDGLTKRVLRQTQQKIIFDTNRRNFSPFFDVDEFIFLYQHWEQDRQREREKQNLFFF